VVRSDQAGSKGSVSQLMTGFRHSLTLLRVVNPPQQIRFLIAVRSTKDQAYDSISAEVLYPTPGALAWGDFTTPSGGLYPGRPLGDCANIVCVVAQGSARCCNSGGATRKQGGA
jgi:hypothetical protein